MASLFEDGKPGMIDKNSVVENELMKEIISIRIDTLWKMIAQKMENRLPEIDEEGATGKFDNKGAIFIPGGLVYREWMPAIHFLYVAAIIFGLSCLAVFAVSLLTPPLPENKVREFTWQQKIYDRETIEISKLPFMLNYRYLSALLIAFLILILLVFW
jgi:hypothetical protein